MGSVDRLCLKLARTWIAPHERVVKGKTVHVGGYWRYGVTPFNEVEGFLVSVKDHPDVGAFKKALTKEGWDWEDAVEVPSDMRPYLPPGSNEKGPFIHVRGKKPTKWDRDYDRRMKALREGNPNVSG